MKPGMLHGSRAGSRETPHADGCRGRERRLYRAWFRAGGVVDEVVGEQFIEQSEIALALDLFGVAADHCLGRFGFTVG